MPNHSNLHQYSLVGTLGEQAECFITIHKKLHTMELPDEFHTFWSAEVLPGKPCTVKIPSGTECSLTNVAVAATDQTPGVVTLSVSVNGSPPVAIAPFTIGSFESTGVDIKFSHDDTVVFATSGAPLRVHLCGYLTGGFFVDVENGAPPRPPREEPDAVLNVDGEKPEPV